MVVSYVGNWDDVSAGKEQAMAQIGRRTDVIFQNADAAGLGIFAAARETRSAYVIGANADQNAIAPEVTIGSVVIDLRHAFLLVAAEVKARTFTSRVVSLGARGNVVRLARFFSPGDNGTTEVHQHVRTRFPFTLEGQSDRDDGDGRELPLDPSHCGDAREPGFQWS